MEKHVNKICGVMLILVFSLLLFGNLALASDITNAEYDTTITITNNSTVATNVFVPFTLSTSDMITGGMINATATDAVMRQSATDVAFMPGWSTNPWITYLSSIGTSSQVVEHLFSKGATGGTIRYFPAAGGFQTADSPTLELGNNFTIEQKGYLDTTAGASKYLVNKPGAITVIDDTVVSGNITVNIWGGVTWVIPTSTVDGSGNWSNDANAIDGNTTTKASINIGAAWSDYLEVDYTNNITCNQVRINVNKVSSDQASCDIYYSSAWHEVYSGSSHANNAWYAITLDPPQTISKARVRLHATGASTVDFYEFAFGQDTLQSTVSATGISSGEKTVTTRGTANYPQWATGSVLHFDGTANSYVDAGAIYNAATNITISIWRKFDSTYTAGSGTRYLWGKRISNNDMCALYAYSGDGMLYFKNVSGGVVKYDIGGFLLSSVGTNWFNVRISISSVTGAAISVNNGTEVTSADTTPLPNGGNFVIGNLNTSGSGGGAIGLTQNVVVTTDALTTGEKAALYAGTAPADATDYWYMDEGTGAAITSYGSSANPGTAGAATAWQTSTYTSGSTGRLCDFTIQVDSSRWGKNLKGVSVPSNSNGYTFLQNYSMPYMEYQKITIGGTQQQYVYWEYAANFSDHSPGGLHPTTSTTFRTASSDADVSAVVTGQAGIGSASSPTSPTAGGWTMITRVPSTPAHLFTEGGDTYPLGDQVTAWATDAGDPPEVYHYLIAYGLSILAIIITFGATHNSRLGRRGSLALAFVAGLIPQIFFMETSTIQGFLLIPYVIIAFFIVLWTKSPSPVD